MTSSTRSFFTHQGRTLSYLDYGPADGPVLLALHGHLNEARFVDEGGVPAGTGHRVVALDQRGHGDSDHATDYATQRYVDDALALLDHLGVEHAVVLGHSLGAAVAYLLAARAPERVDALVVVDIGADINGSLDLVLDWPERAATREDLVAGFGFMGANQAYVMRRYDDGWGVPWHRAGMVASQRALNGNHWEQWLNSGVPALVVHGTQSPVLTGEQAEQMARRRPNTTLVHLEGGHAIYLDAPDGYAQAVRGFLAAL